MKRKRQSGPEKKNPFRRKLRESCVNLTPGIILLASVLMQTRQSRTTKKTEDYDLPSAMELLKHCKEFFKDRSDTAFKEMRSRTRRRN
ncbi:hypothetical protein TNCV_5022841 [Trichonephila clavipes]|nr:hypothetical protein TNCV_5022841 [Trichonephila clavipes]